MTTSPVDLSEGIDGFHNGWDHALVEWDDTHVAAIYSEEASNGGIAQMLTVTAGVVVGGPKCLVYDTSAGSEGEGGKTHHQARVGNLLVQVRRDTGRMFTLDYAGGEFTLVDTQAALAFEAGGTSVGARIVPWSDDTMLLVQFYTGAGGSFTTGACMFAQWDGTTWQFGTPTTSTTYQFGNPDYSNAVRVIDQADDSVAALALTGSYGGGSYAVITGDFPAAPDVNITATGTFGTPGYYNFEVFPVAATDYDHALRAVPVNAGTLDEYGGSGDFDWAYLEVTLNGGVVTEGSPATVGATDGDWYDVALAETGDGHVWAAYSPPGSGNFNSTLVVRDVTAATETSLVDADDGIVVNDVSSRNLARVGNGVVTAWSSRGNRIVRAQAFGLAEMLAPGLAANLGIVGQRFL